VGKSKSVKLPENIRQSAESIEEWVDFAKLLEIRRMQKSVASTSRIDKHWVKKETPMKGDVSRLKGRVCGVGCTRTRYGCVVLPFCVDVERSKHS
jgi:hypothetical protein